MGVPSMRSSADRCSSPAAPATSQWGWACVACVSRTGRSHCLQRGAAPPVGRQLLVCVRVEHEHDPHVRVLVQALQALTRDVRVQRQTAARGVGNEEVADVAAVVAAVDDTAAAELASAAALRRASALVLVDSGATGSDMIVSR